MWEHSSLIVKADRTLSGQNEWDLNPRKLLKDCETVRTKSHSNYITALKVFVHAVLVTLPPLDLHSDVETVSSISLFDRPAWIGERR